MAFDLHFHSAAREPDEDSGTRAGTIRKSRSTAAASRRTDHEQDEEGLVGREGSAEPARALRAVHGAPVGGGRRGPGAPDAQPPAPQTTPEPRPASSSLSGAFPCPGDPPSQPLRCSEAPCPFTAERHPSKLRLSSVFDPEAREPMAAGRFRRRWCVLLLAGRGSVRSRGAGTGAGAGTRAASRQPGAGLAAEAAARSRGQGELPQERGEPLPGPLPLPAGPAPPDRRRASRRRSTPARISRSRT